MTSINFRQSEPKVHADREQLNSESFLFYCRGITRLLKEKMSNNTAPDSWEQQADSNSATSSPTNTTADVTAKFSTLNVNAVEFVPSFAKTNVGIEQISPTKSEESEDSQEMTGPILNGRRCVSFVTFLGSVEVRWPPSLCF